MSTLKIWKNGEFSLFHFTGEQKLSELLSQAGYLVDHPCGGRGVCGKCAVEVTGCVSEPNAAEKKAGKRLSCQAVVLGDAEVFLPDSRDTRIQMSGRETEAADPMAEGIGAAVDIGTTTLAMKLYDMESGKTLSSAARTNPQRSIAADVMGRIGAAMAGQGETLKNLIRDALSKMLDEACGKAGVSRDDVSVMVITGNTTMLYLLEGSDPSALSHAPFEADRLFGEESSLFGKKVYYPACMNAFVGADISCAVLASRMYTKDETSLLCDIGTNGEIALWKDGRLYVSSTAAGPAFEGAGISCGCGSIDGAVDKVRVEEGRIEAHTIGDVPAVGVCGSGLIDAIAAFLQTGDIDETGAVEGDDLPLRDGVALIPKDVRAVQLAKAAIAAGIRTILETAGVEEEEISALYIAGGFGSHLNVSSAAAIGLIPQSLEKKAVVIGNAALSGAAEILLNRRQKELAYKLASESQHINLGGNPKFNENYIEEMMFGDDEL
ncbi:MAG: ASKHA domain-containing protein [Candidatus Limivicinus sp.]|jgi:uncharacterized 2Fe-2S/4Fe-4S cluster protein (DUF4445 family)